MRYLVTVTEQVYFTKYVRVEADTPEAASAAALAEVQDEDPMDWGSDPSPGDPEVLDVEPDEDAEQG